MVFGEKPVRQKMPVEGWTYLSTTVVRLPTKWFPHIKYEDEPTVMKVWPKEVPDNQSLDSDHESNGITTDII